MNDSIDVSPLERNELIQLSQESRHSIAPHLPVIYALAKGIQSKRSVELGIGLSTRLLRLVARECNGVLYSCDSDIQRFHHLLDEQDSCWQLQLGPSEDFLKRMDPPIDFVLHDAAHDYFQVKLDLEIILPKMRAFGLICLHDTQQTDLHAEMLCALRDSIGDKPVSVLNLPFGAGLAMLRVEESAHPPIQPRTGTLPDGRPDTCLVPFHVGAPTPLMKADRSIQRWIRWRFRKMIKGY